MSPDPSRSSQLSGSRSRMHRHWLADDQAIRDQFADGLPRVGVGDFVDFIRVKPDLALATTNYRRGKALLGAEIDPRVCGGMLAECGIFDGGG